jgi:hypothetical protein
MREYKRWQRAEWRAVGLCLDCGRLPAVGRVKCANCLCEGRERVHLSTWRKRQGLR